MPEWLVGGADGLGAVAGKAALMYAVALLGLRLAHRRTVAQWTAIDFAAAVAIGAIVGRTAIARDQSFLVGAVALITLLAAHTAVTVARRQGWFARTVEHRIRVLVDHGELRRGQMRLCGITEDDLFSRLRQQGVGDISELRYVLYEAKGEITIVRERGAGEPDPHLVQLGLADAAGHDQRGPD